MKHFIILSGMVLLQGALCLNQAQGTDFHKVPKQISFETAWLYTLKNEMTSDVQHGLTTLFDYGWQLSGFSGKRAGFITVPLGYTMIYPKESTSQPVRLITYGWTVRHELRPQQGWVPYLGYGLMLSQYTENEKAGRIFGHFTRFSFGINYYNSSRFIPFAQVDYGMTNYPKADEKGSDGLNYLETRIGIRFRR